MLSIAAKGVHVSKQMQKRIMLVTSVPTPTELDRHQRVCEPRCRAGAGRHLGDEQRAETHKRRENQEKYFT